MAGKLTALGSKCYVGSADVSGDIGALTGVEATLSTKEVTALDASAMERIYGRRDGRLGFAAFFNNDAGQSHLTFSALARTDVQATVAIGTPALGGPAASVIAKQATYGLNIDNSGTLGAAIEFQANARGLEFGELLSAGKQSFATGTVNGTGVDGAASTAYGAAAYIHVFSVASGTATFKVQDSPDNVTYTDVTGLTFTNATGATTERLQTGLTATIARYVRLQGSGVHGAAVVVVNFVRYTETGPS